jgi:ribosomal protein S18 acetylase RimI-like enzyme
MEHKTPIDYARRQEARQARFTASLVAHNEGVAGGVMSYDAPGSWANQACGLGMDGPVTPEDIERLLAFYAHHGADASIEASLLAHPSLFELTSRAGFTIAQVEHVFVRGLRGADALPEAPAGVTVERVLPDDAASVSVFADTITRGYAPAGAALEPALVAISERTARSGLTACFLARVGGEPVGACVAVLDGDEVQLSGASVLHAWRRRGVQTCMLRRRLAHARSRGVTSAIVLSAPGVATERNAWRMGFRPSYGRVNLTREASGTPTSRCALGPKTL